MNQNPTLSIIIPTFDRARVIEKSVQSVLRQTYEDFELIVVDDCSNDNTFELVSAVRDPRLVCIRHERNAGGGAARNTGIQASHGQFVAFQDSDDEWLPTKLEQQMAALATGEEGVVGAYCGIIVVEQQQRNDPDARISVRFVPQLPHGVHAQDDLSRALLCGHSLVSTQTLVVRRDVILAAGGFDEQLPALQDWDCAIRIAERGSLIYLNEPLVIQRFSDNSLTLSSRNRVLAKERILHKYAHRLHDDAACAASQYHTLAGGFRIIGCYDRAQHYGLCALRYRPFRLRTWMALMLALAAGAVTGVARRFPGADFRKKECTDPRIGSHSDVQRSVVSARRD